MGGVLVGFAGLAVVAALGYLLARWRLLPPGADVVLARLTFYAAAPALLFRTLAGADIREVFSAGAVVMVATNLALGVLFFVGGRLLSSLRGAELTLGALTASYVNAGNLGIPILVVAVGHAADVAPVLLLQLLVLVPVAFTLLDAQTGRSGLSRVQAVTMPLRNPLVIAVVLGLFLALLQVEVPGPIIAPVDLLADLAVPAMLVAFGVSLRGAPLPGQGDVRGPLWAAVVLRCLGGPVLGWVLGRQIFGLEGPELLGPLLVTALPTAQNVFVYAIRYDRGVSFVRDAVLVTTIVAVPVMVALVALVG